MSTRMSTVAKRVVDQFSGALYPQAVRIITPFAERVPLSSCGLEPALTQTIERYEPKVKDGGLFPHQAKFFKAFRGNPSGDFIVTTATGSGKSLCFWAWVLQHLREDTTSTALLCFPTQALMWGQAERMRRLSESKSLQFPNQCKTPYGGVLRIGAQKIGWTIWQGVGTGPTTNRDMKEHETVGTVRSVKDQDCYSRQSALEPIQQRAQQDLRIGPEMHCGR